uniref:Cysteine rich secreted protein n=1 Tax=Riptortus pedestris TaxID=329032 RepID=R4WKU9_RIPPE|nr:cysteine rich secreted protein [Riptortus pedestris]
MFKIILISLALFCHLGLAVTINKAWCGGRAFCFEGEHCCDSSRHLCCPSGQSCCKPVKWVKAMCCRDIVPFEEPVKQIYSNILKENPNLERA